MSVSKNWDTNLSKSERKTLIAFLALYITLCLLILSLLGFIYYSFQKYSYLQNEKIELNEYANMQIQKLKNLQNDFKNENIYPRDYRFNSAIYDSDEKEIFSTLKEKPKNLNNIIYEHNGFIHFIKEPESYYLGARYVVVEIEDKKFWKKEVFKSMIFYGGTFFVILLIFGYFLLKILLSPMKNTINILDRFIKDTTHELNTPISTISNNIELINIKNIDEKNAKRLKRVDIAAKTISSLYQDLTYLTLGHNVMSQNEMINVAEVLEERLDFFGLLCEAKSLHVKKEIAHNVFLFIDKNKLSKLIDNLLSNAIKYNKQNGFLHVKLQKNYLEIKDSGSGILKENINDIFKRYSRFNSSVGGFGIGLNIVFMIAKEYNLKVEIDSKLKEGTCVKLSW